MKRLSALSEKPKVRALAWVVCVVGLAFCVVCGQQVKWLSDQGGYQANAEENVLNATAGELLRDYTNIVAEEYVTAREVGRSTSDVRDAVEDEGFVFTITDEQGTTLLTTYDDAMGKAQYDYTLHTQFFPIEEEETFYRTYNTIEEREEALQTLMDTYGDVSYTYEDHVYEGDGNDSYILSATYRSDGETVPITVTGYAMATSGALSSLHSWAFSMSYRADALALITLVSGVLGVLALALLLRGAGYRREENGDIALSWMDRRVPTDILVLGMVVLFVLWMAMGGTAVTMHSRSVGSVLPLYPLILTGVAVALLVAGAVSLVRRHRAGVLRENLIFYRYRGKLPRPRDLWHRFLHFFLQFWAAGLCFVGLCILEFICLYMYQATMDGSAVLVWSVLKVLEGILVIYVILAMKEIWAGGDQLAAGNLDYQVPTNRLYGEFRKHGENLNNLRGGIQHAVEEQMKSERMKTELITNVSHDIKTPLTSIVSYVDLLKKEPMPTDQAKEYLDVLDRQAARLKKLIEDLVEASKASTGSLTVNFQPTDVNVLLSQSAGEYQEKLAARDLSLVLTTAEEAPMISADGQLLWRVFENLLSNAQKYAMPGTRVYLSCQATEAEVAVTFRNISATPLNISAEELMDRFVRGDASRNTEGSGLGLAIARDLTQLQRGTFALTIDGDLFKATLTFPRCQKTQDPAGK